MAEHDDTLRTGSQLVAAGRKREWTGPVVNPPVWRGSTHLYRDCEEFAAGKKQNTDGNFFYGRRGSPTQWALCDALTQLEPGAFGTVLYPSGVAAIAGALLTVLKPGDVLLVTDNAYDPSRAMATGLLKNLGVTTRFFDPLDLDGFAAKICPQTKAVWLESPGSLTMEVCDIPALTAIARAHKVTSLIDNTWASALGFPALRHGCDIAMMSLTKHVGGHSDVMMGSISAGERWYRRVRRTAQGMGQVVSPDDASLALRGLRTMGLRLDHTAASATKIAEFLQSREEVAHVLCPMVTGSAGHDIWRRDFTGGCGLFSFVLKGRDDAARRRFIDGLTLFGIGYSWGGYESLAMPFDPSPDRTETSWPPAGWDPHDRHAVRLAIGLEDTDDLIDDLTRAFAAMEKP